MLVEEVSVFNVAPGATPPPPPWLQAAYGGLDANGPPGRPRRGSLGGPLFWSQAGGLWLRIFPLIILFFLPLSLRFRGSEVSRTARQLAFHGKLVHHGTSAAPFLVAELVRRGWHVPSYSPTKRQSTARRGGMKSEPESEVGIHAHESMKVLDPTVNINERP